MIISVGLTSVRVRLICLYLRSDCVNHVNLAVFFVLLLNFAIFVLLACISTRDGATQPARALCNRYQVDITNITRALFVKHAKKDIWNTAIVATSTHANNALMAITSTEVDRL